MKSHLFFAEMQIERPLQEVFKFFSKAENLNKITPPELEFKSVTPLPIVMQQGTHIDYKLKLNGISFSWKTEISSWNPPYSFVDTQLKGPYKIWVHEHAFIEINGFTHMRDTVEYCCPGWIFEPLIHTLFIEKRVKAIFNYREVMIHRLFPPIIAER